MRPGFSITSTPKRVDDRDGAPAGRLDQPGDAEVGVRPELERVAVPAVDAAQDHVDRFEPPERPGATPVRSAW